VNQITNAMNHLNSATQQNASASEELSATAEELSGQAAQLQDMMAFFRLAHGPMAASGAAHRPAAPRHEPAHRAPSEEAMASRSGGYMPMARPAPAHTAIDEAHFGRF